MSDSPHQSAREQRQSDRVSLAIQIEVIGADALGVQFFQRTVTSLLSRHGATIVLDRKLVPDLELTIRCLNSGKESEARVVGMIGQEGDSFLYGVALLNAPADFWGVEFPPLSEEEPQAIRILLWCAGCKRREIVPLDEVELQVLEANGSLQRYCKVCLTITRWNPESDQALTPMQSQLPVDPPLSEIPPAAKPVQRKHNRVTTKLQACIREWGLKSEVVLCEDISKGGLRFLSRTRYEKNTRVEVAVPCAPGGAGNIFVPARIMHVQPAGQLFRHGAKYLKENGRAGQIEH